MQLPVNQEASGLAAPLRLPAAALRHAGSSQGRLAGAGVHPAARVPVPGTRGGSLSSLGGSWFNVPGPGSHAGVSDVAWLAAPSVPAAGWQTAPLSGQGEV